MAELQALLQPEFVNCRVIVHSRSCNKAADAIAALGRSLSSGV